MLVKNLPEWNLISVEDFCQVSSQERILINNSIEKNYLQNPFDDSTNNQFPLYDDPTSFFSHLYEKYKELCYELFGNFHITPQNKTTCWCYRSNINDFRSGWHNHLLTSTINGVYYYQVDGDGIEFKDHSRKQKYIPEQGELIIFPNYLIHRPCVATSNRKRYSINMEIITQQSVQELFGRLD